MLLCPLLLITLMHCSYCSCMLLEDSTKLIACAVTIPTHMLCRTDGFMLFDDYQWPVKGAPGSEPYCPDALDSPEHPMPGIDAFLSIMQSELQVITC